MQTCNACEKESAALIRDGRLLLCGACLATYYGSGADDAESCAVCGEPADVLDDGAVPYCARCNEREADRERQREDEARGYRCDASAASDREVMS